MSLQKDQIRFIFVAVGLGLIYCSTILIIIGLTTNNWNAIWDNNWHNRKIEVEFGLHRVCFKKSEKCSNPLSNYDQSNTLPKVRVLVILGGFVSMLSTVFAMLNAAGDRLGWSKHVIIAPCVVFAYLAGLFEMIGLILYSTRVEITNEYISFFRDIRLGWSFGLTCLAVAFLFIGGTLQALSATSKPTPRFE